MSLLKAGRPSVNKVKALQQLEKPMAGYVDFLQKINQDFEVKIKEINILSDYFIL